MTLFDQNKRILLLGDVYIDHHMDAYVTRLGGLFHGVRATNVLQASCSVGYFAPSYLKSSIVRFLQELGTVQQRQIGVVNGSPSVMLIEESKENGDQGYCEILRSDRDVELDEEALEDLLQATSPTDILIFPGNYPVEAMLKQIAKLECRLHIDGQYAADLNLLHSILGRKFNTVFISVSSLVLKDLGVASVDELWGIIEPITQNLVVKENRGGSRLYSEGNQSLLCEIPCYPVRTEHSVGVGDCYNCVWIASNDNESPLKRLRRASFYASIYASTFNHQEYVDQIANAMLADADVIQLLGTRLAWETRRNIHVYIAAPDFQDIDTSLLNTIEKALEYHNFTPHRPIKENGIASTQMPASEAYEIYARDLQLLENCQVLIAVPLLPDPGTFVEVGYFAVRQRPTILFDPGNKYQNLFLRNTVSHTVSTVGELIDTLFRILGKRI